MSFFPLWKNVTSCSDCPSIRYVAYNTREGLDFHCHTMPSLCYKAPLRCCSNHSERNIALIGAHWHPSETDVLRVVLFIPFRAIRASPGFCTDYRQFTIHINITFNASTWTSILQLHTVRSTQCISYRG